MKSNSEAQPFGSKDSESLDLNYTSQNLIVNSIEELREKSMISINIEGVTDNTSSNIVNSTLVNIYHAICTLLLIKKILWFEKYKHNH